MRIFIIATALFTPFAASAEDSARATGVYVRGGGGVVFGEALNQDLAYHPSIAAPAPLADGKDTDLGEGLSLSAAIGFQYGKTRTELEYRRMTPSIDAVAYTGGTPIAPGPAVNDDFEVQALMSNVYFDLVNKSRLTPYIGFGVGGARLENELGERDAVFAYQGRAGVDVALSRKLSVGAEYVYFRTLDFRYGPEEFDPSTPGGPRTDGDPFVSSSVMGNLRLVF